MDARLFPTEYDQLVLCTFPSVSKVSAFELRGSWGGTYLIFSDIVKLLSKKLTPIYIPTAPFLQTLSNAVYF